MKRNNTEGGSINLHRATNVQVGKKPEWPEQAGQASLVIKVKKTTKISKK